MLPTSTAPAAAAGARRAGGKAGGVALYFRRILKPKQMDFECVVCSFVACAGD